MKRWPRAPIEPQLESAALMITRSPSMIGAAVRPPCVVNAANSSPIERSHSSLPSRLSAITVAPAPRAYTLPVSGSAAGVAQPTRWGGTSLWKMLNRYSQTSFPVSVSSAMMRSWSSAPRPTGFWTKTRLPRTIGVDRPP